MHNRYVNNRSLTLSILFGITIIVGTFFVFQLQFDEQSVPNKILTDQKNLPGFTIDEQNPIKVGILHSLTGTMAISEHPVMESTILAIDEINQQGGLLGRKVVPVIVDGESDLQTFEKQAEYLITEENVSAVFGGWTSASRKTMLPIFEKYDHALFYPVQYEGLESSKNIIYTGAAPNQQVIPGVEWAFENLGSKFFLVGSDYVFPRSANEIIKERIIQLGGSVVGEEYRPLGNSNFNSIVEKIKKSDADVILNTINGDSNIWFFKSLRENGVSSENIPTISFSISESEIGFLGTYRVSGDYASWNYFQSLTIPENEKFVKNFKAKFGTNRVTSDPMEAGYTGVYLFAKAVEKAKSDDPKRYLLEIRGLTFSSPSGIVGVDPNNQHLAKVVRIGQIQPDGQFKIIFSSENAIRPIPYPDYKTTDQWHVFLNNLYSGWNNQWANPSVIEVSDLV